MSGQFLLTLESLMETHAGSCCAEFCLAYSGVQKDAALLGQGVAGEKPR
jgi:hypothetical protein